jgi:hypothetical protein
VLDDLWLFLNYSVLGLAPDTMETQQIAIPRLQNMHASLPGEAPSWCSDPPVPGRAGPGRGQPSPVLRPLIVAWVASINVTVAVSPTPFVYAPAVAVRQRGCRENLHSSEESFSVVRTHFDEDDKLIGH